MTEDTAVRWLHPARTGGLSVLKSSSYDGLVPPNGTFVPGGSPGHSSKRQASGAGERPDEHDRRTRRRTGVVLRRTPYGGHSYRRSASPVTGTADVLPVTVTGSYSGSSSIPVPDCRHRWPFRPERAGATFPFVLRPSTVPFTTNDRSVRIRSRCSRRRVRIPSRVDSPHVHRSSEDDYRT